MAGSKSLVSDKTAILCVVFFAFSFFSSSCTGGGVSYGGFTPGTSAYLPYIESISTDPAVVVEGEPYDVIAHVSCQLNPEILRGEPADSDMDQSSGKWHWTWLYTSMAFSVSNPEDWIEVNNPWIVAPAETGTPVDSFVLRHVNGSYAGTRVIQVMSADSPEWGGLESTYYNAPSIYVEDHPHAVYREFEIRVLPADEE